MCSHISGIKLYDEVNEGLVIKQGGLRSKLWFVTSCLLLGKSST